MSSLEDGRRWVEKKFLEIGKELGVRIDDFAWKEDGNTQQILSYSVSGDTKLLKFSRMNLEFIETDASVQRPITQQIRAALKGV